MNVESTDETDLTRGYATALLSAAILSTTAIFIRYLTLNYDMPALVLAFWRAVFVALTLLPILAIRRRDLLRTTSKHREYLLLFGFILSIFNSLWTLSVAMNGAAISTVLAYSSAAFTALLGRWLLQERLGWGKILAVVLCITGCVLVAEAYDANAWQSNTLGILTGILSGLAYAVYSLMGRSASQRGLNPWTTLCYTFSFAAVFLLAYNRTAGDNQPLQGFLLAAGFPRRMGCLAPAGRRTDPVGLWLVQRKLELLTLQHGQPDSHTRAGLHRHAGLHPFRRTLKPNPNCRQFPDHLRCSHTETLREPLRKPQAQSDVGKHQPPDAPIRPSYCADNCMNTRTADWDFASEEINPVDSFWAVSYPTSSNTRTAHHDGGFPARIRARGSNPTSGLRRPGPAQCG